MCLSHARSAECTQGYLQVPKCGHGKETPKPSTALAIVPCLKIGQLRTTRQLHAGVALADLCLVLWVVLIISFHWISLYFCDVLPYHISSFMHYIIPLSKHASPAISSIRPYSCVHQAQAFAQPRALREMASHKRTWAEITHGISGDLPFDQNLMPTWNDEWHYPDPSLDQWQLDQVRTGFDASITTPTPFAEAGAPAPRPVYCYGSVRTLLASEWDAVGGKLEPLRTQIMWSCSSNVCSVTDYRALDNRCQMPTSSSHISR